MCKCYTRWGSIATLIVLMSGCDSVIDEVNKPLSLYVTGQAELNTTEDNEGLYASASTSSPC